MFGPNTEGTEKCIRWGHIGRLGAPRAHQEEEMQIPLIRFVCFGCFSLDPLPLHVPLPKSIIYVFIYVYIQLYMCIYMYISYKTPKWADMEYYLDSISNF